MGFAGEGVQSPVGLVEHSSGLVLPCIEELVDLVDPQGVIAETDVPRSQVDQFSGLHMQVAIVVVFNEREQVLTQRRVKPPHAGCLDHICGTVSAGEQAIEAAVRESKEETGLVLPAGEIALVDKRVNGFNRFRYLFAAIANQIPVIGRPQEIAEVAFREPHELQRLQEASPDAFMPSFRSNLTAAAKRLGKAVYL